MPNDSFEVLIADWKRNILPRAARTIEQLHGEGRAALASDPAALRLLDLNFREKGRLLAVGSCYAAGASAEVAPALVDTLVRWGALFTMIDTAIDEGGIQERAGCETLAGYLVEAGPGRTPLERYLRDLREGLAMPPVLEAALRPYFARHARLVTYQHLPANERSAYLSEVGGPDVVDYEGLCVDGSPGPIFALLRTASEQGPRLDAEAVQTVERLYFPEFGLLHVWVDDLADVQNDHGTKDLNLAARAAASGADPRQVFDELLRGYLGRIATEPSRRDVLFPLRLVVEEYLKEARVSAPGTAAERALEEAVALVRAAYGEGAS